MSSAAGRLQEIQEIVLEGVQGNAIEIDAEIDTTGAQLVELNVLRAPGKEEYIFDFIGMLGVPLVPLGRIDASYPAAVFATQSWEENVFAPQLSEFMKAGKPVTLTLAGDGEELDHLKAQIARLGLGYVPENRDIFPTLTVRQNLLLGQKSARQTGRWAMSDMFALFPRLEERADTAAGVLSGGEQQMLTMCRTLMGDPDLVIIDEPTEGLAPKLVEQVGTLLDEIARRGVAILLVEQKLTIALRISKRLYVMGHGRIVFEGDTAALQANMTVRKEWLEV